MANSKLTKRERAVLDFEGSWWLQADLKAEAIRSAFGMSPTSYYRLLSAIIERPEAMAHDPLVVRRLLRSRAERRRLRYEGQRNTWAPQG